MKNNTLLWNSSANTCYKIRCETFEIGFAPIWRNCMLSARLSTAGHSAAHLGPPACCSVLSAPQPPHVLDVDWLLSAAAVLCVTAAPLSLATTMHRQRRHMCSGSVTASMAGVHTVGSATFGLTALLSGLCWERRCAVGNTVLHFCTVPHISEAHVLWCNTDADCLSCWLIIICADWLVYRCWLAFIRSDQSISLNADCFFNFTIQNVVILHLIWHYFWHSTLFFLKIDFLFILCLIFYALDGLIHCISCMKGALQLLLHDTPPPPPTNSYNVLKGAKWISSSSLLSEL